ncbi:MAG TPA: DUF433 domain-containing protein [Thermoanaerobaculia bacterium]|nr:DUF433 domain-containing protein [Thermoanaerobaculia bacterium]
MSGSDELLERITTNPEIYGGKPILRGHRMAVEHVLQLLGAGSTVDELLHYYPWMEPDDIRACLVYAARIVGGQRVKVAASGE